MVEEEWRRPAYARTRRASGLHRHLVKHSTSDFFLEPSHRVRCAACVGRAVAGIAGSW
jgi:hypothetical protein